MRHVLLFTTESTGPRNALTVSVPRSITLDFIVRGSYQLSPCGEPLSCQWHRQETACHSRPLAPLVVRLHDVDLVCVFKVVSNWRAYGKYSWRTTIVPECRVVNVSITRGVLGAEYLWPGQDSFCILHGVCK